MLKVLFFILIVTLSGCEHDSGVRKVSPLIGVISNPEKYEGEKIMVEGYFDFDLSGEHRLFHSKSAMTNLTLSDSIYVYFRNKNMSIELEACNEGLVRLYGVVLNRSELPSYVPNPIVYSNHVIAVDEYSLEKGEGNCPFELK